MTRHRARIPGPALALLAAPLLTVPLLFLATAPAPVAAQEPGQQAGQQMGQQAGPIIPTSGERPELPLTETDRVRTADLADENVYEIVIGPVELPSGMPHLRLPIQIADVDVNGWMRGFSWEIRNADGEKLPDDLLHHVNLIDPDRRSLFSPIARRLMAAGRETVNVMLPRTLGIPLGSDTRLMVAAMFANDTGHDHEEAYLHVQLHYAEEGGSLIRPQPVFPFYMDVMGPVGRKDFPVPPGRTVQGWEGSPAIDARIIGIGGHLHDYAVALRLIDVTTGEVLWETEPIATESGHVESLPVEHLWKTGGVEIRKDHTYRAEVVYENPLDRPAPGRGMGVVAGIVAAPEDAPWPEFERTDPAYLEDMRNTLTAPHRMDGHGHGHGEHASAGGAEGARAAGHSARHPEGERGSGGEAGSRSGGR